LAFGAGAASAGRTDPPGHRDANHCVTGLGVDLNELFGVSDQFLARGCNVVSAGEHWIRSAEWITNGSDDPVYPAGYVPARPAPIEDFLSKLIAVKIVVDGGTRQQQTYVFSPGQVERTDVTADQLQPGLWDPGTPMAIALPRMAPVSVGPHTSEPILVLSAKHCDGFFTDEARSCLPAGETSYVARPFQVVEPTP